MNVHLTDRFASLVGLPETDVPLDEVALLIAAHAYPELDVPTQLARIDTLADRCSAPTVDALTRYLFADLGFVGNTNDYFDPRNSFLNDVMDRRTGIPISLAVLTMAVGRRLGIPLLGVGMPGHFLLRDGFDPNRFVDPFAGGGHLDRAGCEHAFRSVHGPGPAFDIAFLEPVEAPTIVARMLANLLGTYASRGDRHSLVWVLRLRTLLPESPPEERAELAAVLASDGQFQAAATEFELVAEQLGGALGNEYRQSADRLRARMN